jgi:hypothetical protein
VTYRVEDGEKVDLGEVGLRGSNTSVELVTCAIVHGAGEG